LRLEVLCARPPLPSENVCCLAVIMGETGDSGTVQALDGQAILVVLPND
jgi:hypothetical protein